MHDRGFGPSIRLSSSAFSDRQSIPERFTCDGDGISPPLSWADVPEDAESLVLVMTNPEVPELQRAEAELVHWVVYDLPPGDGGIAAGEVPANARVGLNAWGEREYEPPCPEDRRSYVFRIFALDRRLELRGDATWHRVKRAMVGHVLSRKALIGVYAPEEERP